MSYDILYATHKRDDNVGGTLLRKAPDFAKGDNYTGAEVHHNELVQVLKPDDQFSLVNAKDGQGFVLTNYLQKVPLATHKRHDDVGGTLLRKTASCEGEGNYLKSRAEVHDCEAVQILKSEGEFTLVQAKDGQGYVYTKYLCCQGAAIDVAAVHPGKGVAQLAPPCPLEHVEVYDRRTDVIRELASFISTGDLQAKLTMPWNLLGGFSFDERLCVFVEAVQQSWHPKEVGKICTDSYRRLQLPSKYLLTCPVLKYVLAESAKEVVWNFTDTTYPGYDTNAVHDNMPHVTMNGLEGAELKHGTPVPFRFLDAQESNPEVFKRGKEKNLGCNEHWVCLQVELLLDGTWLRGSGDGFHLSVAWMVPQR